MTGNWQLNLTQNYPAPSTQLSASGFLMEGNNALSGSVQGPVVISSNQSHNCGGVGAVTGTISGQNVTFSLNPGGTVFNFTGTISSDNTSMSGTYAAVGGACFVQASTSGTFTASLVPPLNGSFSGTLANSVYMAELTGANPPAPIAVSGSFTQSSNAGASNASISGTITAIGYPCFSTASVTGSISGQSVYLDVFNYNGEQIGTIGIPGIAGTAGTPATVVVDSGGVSLTGTGSAQSGLSLGASGTPPCPAIGLFNVTSDTADVDFTLQ